MTQQVQLKQQVHLTAWSSSSPSNARPLPATSHPPPPCLTCRHPRGPGCSSVGGGFLTEMGPWYPRQDRSLKANPHSWNKWANMLFVEVRLRGSLASSGSEGRVQGGLGCLATTLHSCNAASTACTISMAAHSNQLVLLLLHWRLLCKQAPAFVGFSYSNDKRDADVGECQGRRSAHTLDCGAGCCQQSVCCQIECHMHQAANMVAPFLLH